MRFSSPRSALALLVALVLVLGFASSVPAQEQVDFSKVPAAGL